MKTVLITGSSRGIGFQLARCYAADGWRILLNGRNEESLWNAAALLKEEFHAETDIFACDLSRTGSAEKLYSAVRKKGYMPDCLVNNAGAGFLERSWKIPEDKDEALVVLNDISLMTLCKLFVKDHIAEGKGVIINIASTGAFQPGPYIASYYASKSFAVSYSRALAEEVRPYGIHVCVYCPGPVDTEFYERSGSRAPAGAMDAYSAARYCYEHQTKTVVVPGFLNRAALYVPSGIKMKIVGHLKKKQLK